MVINFFWNMTLLDTALIYTFNKSIKPYVTLKYFFSSTLCVSSFISDIISFFLIIHSHFNATEIPKKHRNATPWELMSKLWWKNYPLFYTHDLHNPSEQAGTRKKCHLLWQLLELCSIFSIFDSAKQIFNDIN